MFKHYLDFEIRFVDLPSAAGYSIIVTGPGGDAEAELLPHVFDAYGAISSRLEVFDTDEALLTSLGQMLFDSIFQGKIKEVYTRSQGMLEPDQGLRVRLNFAAAAARLAALPWEFLYDPDLGPLSLLDAPIVRYLPQSVKIPTLATTLPLKVLLAGAYTPPVIDIDRELGEVQAALADLGEHVQITLEPHLTSGKLQHLLRQGFHIWHFVGHAGFDKDGTTGQLYLEDPTGDVAPISAMQLGIMLNRSGLRLVVLDACQGARLATDPLRSMAPALIRAQLPAVVAMQFAVPEQAARAFAGEFYRALAAGFPIDACVTEGRKAVLIASGLGRVDWGIPVVYTRAPDGLLFELPSTTVIAPSSLSAAVGEGLTALRQLMRLPEVYAVAVRCRDDLVAASKRIGVLAAYKLLHDLFQQLENSYTVLYDLGRRLPDDQTSWDHLRRNLRTFEETLDRLLDCAGQPAIGEERSLWPRQLRQVGGDLGVAIKGRDFSGLTASIDVIGSIISLRLSQFNSRLVAAAGELRLEDLLRALRVVRDRVAGVQLVEPVEAKQFELFTHGVENLERLSEHLLSLVELHDSFQQIDDELRRVEVSLDHNPNDLKSAWTFLKPIVQLICENNPSGWATALAASGANLDTALSANSDVHETFLDYRSQVNRSFNRIDTNVRERCEELREIGDELIPILRMMAPLAA